MCSDEGSDGPLGRSEPLHLPCAACHIAFNAGCLLHQFVKIVLQIVGHCLWVDVSCGRIAQHLLRVVIARCNDKSIVITNVEHIVRSVFQCVTTWQCRSMSQCRILQCDSFLQEKLTGILKSFLPGNRIGRNALDTCKHTYCYEQAYSG